MQEVTSLTSGTGTTYDQLRTGALVDTSSKSRAFADFLGLMAPGGVSTQPLGPQTAGFQAAPALPDTVQADAAAATAATTAATNNANSATSSATASTTASTSGQTAQTRVLATDAGANTARNTPVSREAFEEARPLLTKAGFSDTEMADLAARVQAGTLTWGQLVQSLGSHMTGAKKSVSLSATESADLQTLFQKLGFAGNTAAQMTQSVAKGDGFKVLSAIQNKLAAMPDDATPGVDKDQLATLFKAMGVPAATAEKLTRQLGSESTVADLKAGLAEMGQALKEQHAKTAAGDTELAKGLGKIMEKDVAKNARDTAQTTGSKVSVDSSAPQVGFELKTKDKDDTGWFTQHEKNQQKGSDDVWRSFLAKVRTDDSGVSSVVTTGAQAVAASAKDALDALSGRAGQATTLQPPKAEASQTAKTFEKVVAPKVLDQVSEAMLKDLGQGRKQMTLQLDPENLGKVQVMLQVKGKEITAVLRAEDADTAALLSSNMESLKKTLEEQGLTVQNLEVQTGLASRQDQQAGFNAEQHNQAQERQEMTRIFSQLRMLRADSADLAPDVQNMGMQAILADQGLHIIA